MKKGLLIIILLISSIPALFGQKINIGVRDTIYSNTLKENRPVSIYFPPSYYYKTNQHYPVLYILDGEYNFQYVAGILELQGGISESIPEMILVGISGKGSSTYQRNCKPVIAGIKDSGNADEVLDFIEQELIPYMDKNYKTLDFKILAGHSVGGIFTVNAALKRPDLFDHYIAISPALWWEENAINRVAEENYKSQHSKARDVYVSLADEKRMGVKEFLKLVGPEYKFKQFENENHNSVGAPTYKWALRDIFKNWKFDKKYFDSSKELADYQKEISSSFSIPLPLAESNLYNTVVYILKDKPEELQKIKAIIHNYYPNSETYLSTLLATIAIDNNNYEKATSIINDGLKKHPDSFELYEKLAEVHFKEKKIQASQEEINKAIYLANKQSLRQWRINQLQDLKDQIKTNNSKT